MGSAFHIQGMADLKALQKTVILTPIESNQQLHHQTDA